ncbi:MAG: class I adenylate-forming enzyme family protein [Candidatus Binatia bacterium]
MRRVLVLGEILRRHARVRPEQTAYVIGTARVTYGQFNDRVNRLAHALRALGVRRGERVAVLANNCVQYPLAYFACIKLGAILVPVNARFKDDEVQYVVAHAAVVVVLYGPEFGATIRRLRGCWPCVRHYRSLAGRAFRAWLDGYPGHEPLEFVDEQDPHVMLYTSGTTGRPKGALLSHRAYFLQAAHAHQVTGLSEDDIGLSMFPMFHMGGWALPLGFWHDGGTVIIMERADPRAMLEAVQREHVTYLYAVPTLYNFMLDLPDFERFDLSSLRVLASGTSVMTQEQIGRIVERFRNPNLFIIFGSTEAGPVATLRPADLWRKPGSVGRPALNVELRIVDGHDDELPAGTVGEIVCRSEFAMRGYWQMPDETAAALRGGWVHTGDLGVVDEDGFVFIAGRKKEMIKSGGENIFPAEVERVLLAHAGIAQAAVLGVPDPDWGESVLAVVVPRGGYRLSEAEVIAHVRSRLAGFKKPRYVRFVDALPRTAATRQVQKAVLREQFVAASRERRPGQQAARGFASPAPQTRE